jgi:hypothetical protein
LDILQAYGKSEDTMKSYIFDRLKEASTWRGITLFLTALGIPMAPGLSEAIISAGLAITGLIGVVTKDK